MRAITRIVGAGAATVLALSLVACGSDSGSSDQETKAAAGTSATPAPEEPDDDGGDEITAESLYEALAGQIGKDTSYRMTSTTPGAAGSLRSSRSRGARLSKNSISRSTNTACAALPPPWKPSRTAMPGRATRSALTCCCLRPAAGRATSSTPGNPEGVG